MPTSVIAVIVLYSGVLAVSALSRLISGEGVGAILPSFVIPALLIWGIVKGSRLAWQWGRITGFVGAVVFLAVGGLSISAGRIPVAASAITIVAVGVPLLIIAVLLGSQPSRAWFRLVCPVCHGTKNRAADFLFSRARCRACNHVW